MPFSCLSKCVRFVAATALRLRLCHLICRLVLRVGRQLFLLLLPVVERVLFGRYFVGGLLFVPPVGPFSITVSLWLLPSALTLVVVEWRALIP